MIAFKCINIHIYNQNVAEKKICRTLGNIVEVFKCFVFWFGQYFGSDCIRKLFLAIAYSLKFYTP